MLDWVYHMTEAASNEISQKKRLDDFTRAMVRKRRAAKAASVRGRPCLLDFMIDISDRHANFTEDDIINEATTFMLAGQDSVGASVAFTLSLLARHVADQVRCRDEIDSIFGDAPDRTPTMADLRKMCYLEQCIKESLRLYPSVPLIARRVTEDIRMGGHVLPNTSDVFIIPYATHRLASIYPNPEAFEPARFTAENCRSRHPYAYLPFSAGPRNCVGYKFAMIEIKTVIANVLRKFTLHTVPGREKIVPSFRITLRAQGGLWIRFEPRQRTTSSAGAQ